MARIRTVKPDFWRDEGLSSVSPEAALLAIGLLNHADDEGYFLAHPKLIEADVFPLRELSGNVPGMLSELSDIGYLRVFQCEDGKKYGQIINFLKHQKVSKPYPSKIKDLQEILSDSGNVPGIVKERSPLEKEREWEVEREKEVEKERERDVPGRVADATPPAPKKIPVTNATWASYKTAYLIRYKTDPIRNASVNGQLANVVRRLGAEAAPHVAAFYVQSNNQWYIQKGHSIAALVADCEKLHTEWKTGRQTTTTTARQKDKTQSNFNTFAPLIAEAEAKEGKYAAV